METPHQSLYWQQMPEQSIFLLVKFLSITWLHKTMSRSAVTSNIFPLSCHKWCCVHIVIVYRIYQKQIFVFFFKNQQEHPKYLPITNKAPIVDLHSWRYSRWPVLVMQSFKIRLFIRVWQMKPNHVKWPQTPLFSIQRLGTFKDQFIGSETSIKKERDHLFNKQFITRRVIIADVEIAHYFPLHEYMSDMNGVK